MRLPAEFVHVAAGPVRLLVDAAGPRGGVGRDAGWAAAGPLVDGHPGDGAARYLPVIWQAQPGQLAGYEKRPGEGRLRAASGVLRLRFGFHPVAGLEHGAVRGAAQLLGFPGDAGGQVRAGGYSGAASPAPRPVRAACWARMLA